MVANTHKETIELLKKEGDIALNYFDLHKEQYPLILAVYKGWNHKNKETSQKEIILLLLSRSDLDINVFELQYGYTALHIACLKGDYIELVKLLLEKGADKNKKSLKDELPVDLLNVSYEEVQKILIRLTCFNTTIKFDENHTCTLCSLEERSNNIKEIRDLLI